jgi:hypothetical protein
MPRMDNRPTAPMGPTAVASAGTPQPGSTINALIANSTVDPVGTSSTKPAAPQPAPPAAAASAVPSGPTTASAYVQISSRRSMADATASMNTILNKFGNLFPGATPEIQKVDLGSKGTYYRVRIPASSLQEAGRICSSIKANGGDCFPTKS